jgi:phage terminase small subunit
MNGCDDMAKNKNDIDNPYNLTQKQQLFCQYYIINFNATSAYMKAFKTKYGTSNVEGCKLLVNPSIKKEIKRLKKNISKETFVEAKDIFNLMVKIAFASIDDVAEWGHTIEGQRDMFGNLIIDKKTGKPLTYINNFIKAINNNEVDTAVIQEISQGKDGIKIKLVDKKWALEYLIKHFDLFTDDWKRKIEEEKLKLMKKDTEISENDRPILVDSIEEKFKEIQEAKNNESN